MSALNTTFALRDKGVSNALTVDDHPRHRWYFVKEGFSPALVQHAITSENVSDGDVLLDPFSGGGTTAVTGAISGLKPIGYEVNPFLAFVTRCKLAQVGQKAIDRAANRVLRAMKKQKPSDLEGFSTFSSGNKLGRWLFSQSVLRTFEAGRIATQSERGDSAKLTRLALIGAAMDCCNATRDGKCLRYRDGWAQHQPRSAAIRERFAERMKVIAEDLRIAPIASAAQVTAGDARKLVGTHSSTFRLCVTSPPYLNSFDYSDIYRPELFLGGFVRSNSQLMQIRLSTVRSHLQAKWLSPKASDFGTLYQDAANQLAVKKERLWNPRIPTMVQAYFEDMQRLLRALRKRAQDGASLWLVVSTSAYAGVEIPVDLILADIGVRCGWSLREVGVLRNLRSASQHMQGLAKRERTAVPLRESVVILEAA